MRSRFKSFSTARMVLYAKSLGASATVLGIIAGMMPFAGHFSNSGSQLRSSGRLQTLRLRRLGDAGDVYFRDGTGSAGRLVFLDAKSRLSLMLMLLFLLQSFAGGFRVARGLPWITALVRRIWRGQYLVRDAAYSNFAERCNVL